MTVPQPVIYSKRPKRVLAAAIAGVALLLVTPVFAVIAWHQKDPTKLYILGAVWAVAPPVWFWYEFFFLFRVLGDPAGFEHFKYGQQVAVAIWAGIAIATFAFASSERFKAKNPTAGITTTQPSKGP